jgi:hypothetical protein
MASGIPCDCKAQEVLRLGHLGHHFLKPGDFTDISISKVLNFVQNVGLLNA